MPICIYPPSAEDFTTNGLGILTPKECTIEEVAAGKYELEIVIPIDDTLRWMQLQAGCIIKAPAPVRETPLYEAPALGEPVTVTRQVWEVTGTSHGLYIRSGPSMSYSRIGIKHNGDQVIELEDHPDPWKKVCVVDGGQVGYMSTKYLKPVRTITEVIEPGKPTGGSAVKIGQSRDQLFRVFSVEQDSSAGTVTAQALHVFYDESGNLIDAEYEIEEGKTEEVNSVIASINAKLLTPSTVRFQPINLTGDITGVFSYKTPVLAYLDPDEGIVKQTKALLVRDNYEAYLLPDMVRDRGVTIRRGKNLLGVEVTNDISKVVTRIIPVGKNKNGDPLYLTDAKYVDSPRIGDYPIPRVQRIEYDVQTGKDDFKNDAAVRTEIKRLAEEEYSKNGVDLPTYGMDVDFVLLGNTAEYADFASLQAVHLYDTVTVIDEMLALTAKVRVTGYKWNCLTQQYKSVTLGELQDVKQTVYSYNLPTGGIAGNKIMNNSLGGTALRNATIEYAKITNAAIEQLSANAITALTARIKEIVSEKLTTDELYAAYAEMIALKVGTITAENIETDALAAELARITVLAAGTATFDAATIQHLVAQAMNLEFGTVGQVFIKNLAVEYAQMVGAAIGELCIKASDGNYYLMDVNPDGTVTATRTDVSGGEIAAGQTSGGKVILDTNITAANLNAGNLLATYALINQIDAARINVDQLFAREAFVNLLRTTKIVGDTTITMIAQAAQSANRSFRQEEMPSPSDGIRTGDLWVVPSTGQVFQAESLPDETIQFFLDADGSLYYESTIEDNFLEVVGYDLYADDTYVQIKPDGSIGGLYRWILVQDEQLVIHEGETPPPTAKEGKLWLDRSVVPSVLRRWMGTVSDTSDMNGWETVNDTATIEAAQDALQAKQAALEAEQKNLNTFLRIDAEMVRIGKVGVTSEFQIDPWGAGVAINDKVFSRFESDRVRFGDMEIRRPAVGGLVFDSVEDLAEVNYLGY